VYQTGAASSSSSSNNSSSSSSSNHHYQNNKRSHHKKIHNNNQNGRKNQNNKRPLKFMLQPNGGLSQGLHPMGDFFDQTGDGQNNYVPPHDMFDPLSEGTSPRTWARSPGSGDGIGDRRHVIHTSRHSKNNAKRSLSSKKKTPSTDNGKRSKRARGGSGSNGGRSDGSKSGSRVSQAAKMRAALAMAEFEMISGKFDLYSN